MIEKRTGLWESEGGTGWKEVIKCTRKGTWNIKKYCGVAKHVYNFGNARRQVMNIVIIVCFDTWEHRADLLLKALTEEGHTVRVLMSDFLHMEKQRRRKHKEYFKFFRAEPYKKNLSLKRMLSHLKLSSDIFSWVQANESWINLLWVLAPPNTFVRDAGKIKECHPHIKLVIDLIDLWPETMPVAGMRHLPLMRVWQRVRDINLSAADMVVTECSLYQDVLGKVIKGCKAETLYLAREDQGYAPQLNLPDNSINLCYLGSINHIIDMDAIAAVIRELRKKKPVKLIVIGDGEKKHELRKIARCAGAAVELRGVIYDRTKKQEIFDSCHYGLNIMKSSVCVGLTMKSIDYFEFGIPIINNIKGDTWSAVEKFGCGVNFESREGNLNLSLNGRAYAAQRENSRKFFETYLTEDVFNERVRKIMECTALNQPKRVLVRDSNYGLNEIIRNAGTVILNKMQFPSVRLVRYPFTVRGKNYISWGEGLTAGYNCRIEVNGRHIGKVLTFGRNVNIGDNVSIRCAERIRIGNDVLIGSRALIIDNVHGNYSGEQQDSPDSAPNKRLLKTAPVNIGRNVWIGEGAVIQAGVTIGAGSIIAANSVVTKNVEAGVIAGGVPVRVLKRWNRKKGRWSSA